MRHSPVTLTEALAGLFLGVLLTAVVGYPVAKSAGHCASWDQGLPFDAFQALASKPEAMIVYAEHPEFLKDYTADLEARVQAESSHASMLPGQLPRIQRPRTDLSLDTPDTHPQPTPELAALRCRCRPLLGRI